MDDTNNHDNAAADVVRTDAVSRKELADAAFDFFYRHKRKFDTSLSISDSLIVIFNELIELRRNP